MMNQGYKKYKPFTPIDLPDRQWPNRVIDHAPIWCSVDLRDGNQALVDPMNLEEKLEYFKTLIAVGFKEIEVGFPSASETEYEILRTLIDGHYIPDDVTIQVLVQARPHLIKKTFEAIDGAKNVIVHFYYSTSTLQRKVVFKTDMDGVIQIAVDGARLIYELTEEEKKRHPEMNIRFEYSPESFTGTEMDNAVEICRRVMEELHITKENPIILNLPSTVEGSSPNGYADQIEYFCRHLPNRDAAIISLHPHNDRGEGVAATELALMAGADRVEGTLFGNGERTGNVDVVTLALNMWTQGVDPELDFHNINEIKEVYERCTKMQVPPRQPYAGWCLPHSPARIRMPSTRARSIWKKAAPLIGRSRTCLSTRQMWAESMSPSFGSILSPARAALPLFWPTTMASRCLSPCTRSLAPWYKKPATRRVRN